MIDKGFTVQTGWAGFQYHLMPNTMDPASPLAKQQVREAVEYALDKEAICEAIGYGFYFPIYAVVSPEGEWGSRVGRGQAWLRSGQGQGAAG